MAGPWDSPKFVTQKSLPKVLPDIRWSIVRDQGGFIFCDQRPVYRMATTKLTARSGRATDFQLARSEENTSKLQTLLRISHAVFCYKKKNLKHRMHTKLLRTTR